MQPHDYTPLNPSVRGNPYPYYAVLREQAPVHFVEQLKAFAISRHEDVQAVLKDPTVFSSKTENLQGLLFNPTSIGEEFARMIRTPALVGMDPPLHTRMRTLVSRAFTMRRVAEMEPRVRALTRRLLQALPQRGEFELLETLAVPLPVTVIAELLGVEAERHQDFRRWSNDVVNAGTEMLSRPGPNPKLEASLREFRVYLEGVIAERRTRPREDLITALLQSSDQGLLDVEEVITFVRLLLIAGNETTTNLLANGLIALVRHPEQLEKLKARPELIPNAVEEMLRYDSPVQGVFRFVTQDVELSGKRIPARSMVMPLMGSANRDPRRFEAPERFDVTRAQAQSISFGHGIHFCMGAPLSRMEARVVFEELLPRLRHLSFASDQPQEVDWAENIVLRGPKRLRLAVELAPQGP